MFNISKPNPHAVSVPKATEGEQADRLAEHEVGDDLGSFTGYLRRAKSNAQGLTAQIFGENGFDSDVITTFHLTRFLDARVHVIIRMLKNGVGRNMRKNNEYPKLTEFDAEIRRPLANNMGQVAQFFGANGANSDAINILNASEYLDALVHVQLSKADPGITRAAVDPSLTELDDAAQRMTPTELKVLKEEQRKAKEAERFLQQAGFYRSEAVWRAIGTELEFQEFLMLQPCCQPGEAPCQESPVVPHRLPNGNGYRAIPLCRTHQQVWETGVPNLRGAPPQDFLESQQSVAIQRWAKERLRRTLRVPAGYDPSPKAIYTWAAERHLHTHLPPGFMTLVV